MQIKTKNGFTIVLALVVLLCITIVALSLQFIFYSTDKRVRVSRISFEMSRVEAQARAMFSKPAAYTACAQIPPDMNWDCTINQAAVDSMKKQIIGAKCGQTFCGVAITANVVTDIDNPKVAINISYNGSDLRVSDQNFEVDIPKEAFKGRTGICGVDKDGDGVADGYLYKGVGADNEDDCRGLPSCPDNEFFTGLDSSGAAKCSSLIQGLTHDTLNNQYSVTCPANQYLSGLYFNPNSSNPIQWSCDVRLDPCQASDTLGANLCPPAE